MVCASGFRKRKSDDRCSGYRGGQAGGAVAAMLRQYGYTGSITVVGDEPQPPYQRPPLSKAHLLGKADVDGLLIRPLNYYADQGITLRLGLRASSIATSTKTVSFENGSILPYGCLVLATGATPRKLEVPGADQANLFHLRTLHDADRFRAALGPGRRLAVIGGGYIGLEVAASARQLGVEVIVIERMDRVLQRVASEILSNFFRCQHRMRGVEIRTGVDVAAFEQGGVRLTNGERVSADAFLVGVGASACDALAKTAGLECQNGVVVNESAVTSDPSIYAVGDVTCRPISSMGEMRMRLESVPSALEQAKQAASSIAGRAPPAAETPWFWSDQYDVKLQIAGLPFTADRQVVRGDADHGKFAVFHLREERIVCVEAVNAPAEFMAGRQFIGRRTIIDADRLIDSGTAMRDMATT